MGFGDMLTDTQLMDGFDNLCQRLYGTDNPFVTLEASQQAQIMQLDCEGGMSGRQALEKLISGNSATK